jgi:hypothetical protein
VAEGLDEGVLHGVGGGLTVTGDQRKSADERGVLGPEQRLELRLRVSHCHITPQPEAWFTRHGRRLARSPTLMSGDGPPEDTPPTPAERAEASERLAAQHRTDAAHCEARGDDARAAFHRQMAEIHDTVAQRARAEASRRELDRTPVRRRWFGRRRSR